MLSQEAAVAVKARCRLPAAIVRRPSTPAAVHRSKSDLRGANHSAALDERPFQERGRRRLPSQPADLDRLSNLLVALTAGARSNVLDYPTIAARDEIVSFFARRLFRER